MDTNLQTRASKLLIVRRRIESIATLRISVLVLMLLKTTVFLALLETYGAKTLYWEDMDFRLSLVHLAFIGLIFSFGFLFSCRKQVNFYLILNIAYTLLLILDLWYFRVNRDFLGLKNIFSSPTFNPMNQSLFRPEPVEVIFVIDLILVLAWAKSREITYNQPKSGVKFTLSIMICIVYISRSFVLLNVEDTAGWDKKLFDFGWSPLMTVRAPGPVGYHSFEAFITIYKALKKTNSSAKQEAEAWLSQNKEKLNDNEFKGILKGKNVIFLQLESFENFIINRNTNNKEITPFLNKLTKEGLYFNNIYEQNNAGNSIDCDVLVNTSVLTLGDKITALNYGERLYEKSLPRVLKSEGYVTVTAHAEEPGEFNWTELHKNGFGVDYLWDVNQFNYEETVGYGLSDKSFLYQLADKIKTLPQPFYVNAATLSSHGPYELQQKYRELGLPYEVDKSYLGGYFESAHYTDKQVEMFFNKLDDMGMLNNTAVVIYGDHSGVHKYYNSEIENLDYEGNWWKEYDHEIPLIIYSKGITPKVFETYGGQIDIMPTVSYLLGIDDSKYSSYVMGRPLVNTNKNFTILKDSIIKGQVPTEAEREHLLKAYDIGSKIIKNGYINR